MLNLQPSESNYISRSELYGILETMPFPIILTETDRTVRFANAEALRLGDYDNLEGKKCFETFCRQKLCNCPVTAEDKIRRSNQLFYKQTGESIPVIKQAQPVRFNDDLFFAQFFTDLTQQQNKEAELTNIIAEKELSKQNAESERLKFEQLFQGISDAVFIVNQKGEIIKVNEKACEKHEYSREELESMNIQELVTPETSKKSEKVIQQLQKEKRITFESEHISKSGKIFPVEVTTNFFEFDGQKVVFNTVRDISQRKRIENELLDAKKTTEQNEEELKTIFNKVPSTIIVFDKDTRILRINQKGSVKFNIGRNDVKGKMIGEILNCANRNNGHLECGSTKKCTQCMLLRYIRSTIKNGIEYNKKEVTLNLLEKGKPENHTILLSTAILGSNGNSRYIAAIDDITDRKKMEIELVIAKEKAEISEKLKSAFLNNISHEIRTPLNGLLGFLDFFDDEMEQIPKDDRQLFIKTMRKSGDRLVNTVEDIVEASKLDTGIVDFEKEQIRLSDLINTLEKNVAEKYPETGVDFITHLDESLRDSVIESDKSKLLRILRNLLGNAFKFTHKGRVSLSVIKTKKGIKFSVKDTGIGISKEDLNIIFQPFRQADINMNRAFEGNGLGLTIAYKLSKFLGSELRVESEKNRGSEFSFTLPQISEAEVTGVSSPEEKNNQRKNLENTTILVAEDDDTNYLFLEAVLQKEGCSLIHANNGQEAVNLFLENKKIDLIIMDLKMPVMNGIDATFKIKSIDNSVPIIAHSAYLLNNEKEQSLAAGCVDYIPKPVKKQELLQAIYKHIFAVQNSKN